MMRLKPCHRSFVLLCALLAVTAASAAPDGEALYREHCGACHQSQGLGGIGLPLSRTTLANVSDDYLSRTIRSGRPGRIMPAFDGLSDAQVEAIVRYLRGWHGDPAPTFAATPLPGDPEQGRAVYLKHCASCHAEDGSGEGPGTGVTLSRERAFLIMPPALNNAGFLAAASDALIRHTVATGREGTDMPAFAHRLASAELDNVVAYLRTFAAARAAPNDGPAPDEAPSLVLDSPYDFDTTLANVRQALAGSNFRLFPERYLEQGLIDEFSHNTRQVSVRFCNFKELYNMLNVEPRLGVVLPCRITVLERVDGSVVLVAPNMRTIGRWFNNAELETLGSTMNQIITTVLEEATL